MAGRNTLQRRDPNAKPAFSAVISSTGYQKMINNTLRSPERARRFVSAITSAVATNPELQVCDPATVVSAALLGESLNLSPSPQLGQYYLVPFWNSKKGCKDAQFQLGYRGYIQLALRSGYYKRMNVIAIKEGELERWDPLSEEVSLHLIQDDNEREATPSVGYLATFAYLNGFEKTIYWSREKMEAHAQKYSKGYAAKKGYTFWERDFDSMAFKTMLRHLISRWGVMSIDLQKALEGDEAIVQADGTPEYVTEAEAAAQPIQEAENVHSDDHEAQYAPVVEAQAVPLDAQDLPDGIFGDQQGLF